MRGAVTCAPRDVRGEQRDNPTIIQPADVVIRIAATCVMRVGPVGLAWHRPATQRMPMGHEYGPAGMGPMACCYRERS